MNGFPPNCMKIICFDSKCCPWMLIRMINLWTDDERQMIKQTSKSMTIYSRSSLVNWPFQIESHSENCIFHKRIWFMRSKWNEFASLIFAWTARILFTLFFPLSQCDCEQFYPSDEIYFLQIHIAVVVFRRWRSQFIRWNSINLATDRCFQFNLSFDCFFSPLRSMEVQECGRSIIWLQAKVGLGEPVNCWRQYQQWPFNPLKCAYFHSQSTKSTVRDFQNIPWARWNTQKVLLAHFGIIFSFFFHEKHSALHFSVPSTQIFASIGKKCNQLMTEVKFTASR